MSNSGQFVLNKCDDYGVIALLATSLHFDMDTAGLEPKLQMLSHAVMPFADNNTMFVSEKGQFADQAVEKGQLHMLTLDNII